MKRFCLILCLLFLCSACGSKPPLLTSAPVMTVTAGEAAIEVSRGTASWTYDKEDGSIGGYEVDAVHPLEALLPTLRAAGVPAVLDFGAVPPDKLTVQYWHYRDLGNPDAPPTAGTVTDSSFPLLPDDGYVYEVCAEWSSYERFSGKAYYSFYATGAAPIPDCYVGPEWPPLAEPPEMTVYTGDAFIDIGHSSAQWEYDEDPEDDLATAVIACGDHPLNLKDTLTRIPVTGISTEVSFGGGHDPDTVFIRCWSTDHWGDPDAPAESFPMEGHVLQLRDSGTVYEVTAVWESYDQFSGEATYCFVAE